MVKNMSVVYNDKKIENVKARSFYIDMRNKMSKNVIDLVKKSGKLPAEINSDMALFRDKMSDKTITYYYDRLEIQQGSCKTVLLI